ncbi:MAG: non-hydrolyzing UDP-N-acetylglucosamine 2-epimerase [Chloroflexota bacterium]
MKTLLAAGVRPNFVKAAPIMEALRRAGGEARLVHTGQHADDGRSGAFFRDLGMAEPDIWLAAGGDGEARSPARRMGRIMAAFEEIVRAERPDWVIVLGDVDSTLACGLAAARIRWETGVRVAHVEAGLRCGDLDMPEEVNRRLTDHLSDLLLAPDVGAARNLAGEGIEPGRIDMAGNVMVDTLLSRLDRARERDAPGRFGARPGGYAVATLHRQANVDDPAMLAALLDGLGAVAGLLPVLVPLHPRTRERIAAFGLEERLAPLGTLPPLGYLDMLSLSDGAGLVLTDSGGLQEETTVLGVPCVTLRPSTERPVTISEGTNRLIPWPPEREGIAACAAWALGEGRLPVGSRAPAGWDGATSGSRLPAPRARRPGRQGHGEN